MIDLIIYMLASTLYWNVLQSKHMKEQCWEKQWACAMLFILIAGTASVWIKDFMVGFITEMVK